MRYDVFMPYICSVPQFTWVDQRAGKNILFYKDTNVEPPSERAAERWYKGHRTCCWRMIRLSEAHFMQCDRCTKKGMKDQFSTSNHNFILQQNSELMVSSVTARWGGRGGFFALQLLILESNWTTEIELILCPQRVYNHRMANKSWVEELFLRKGCCRMSDMGCTKSNAS